MLECQDGASRCQLHYTEEKADECDELLAQVSFSVEGVELALRENPSSTVPSTTGGSSCSWAMLLNSFVCYSFKCFSWARIIFIMSKS